MFECTSHNTYTMKSWLHSTVVLVLRLCYVVTDSQNPSNGYDVYPNYDVCNPKTPVSNPNTVYLEYAGISTEVYMNWTYTNSASSLSCLLYFRTCSSCYIKVEAADEQFDYSYCVNKLTPKNDDDNSGYCAVSCPHFFLFDADYMEQSSERVFSTRYMDTYETQSRQLHVIGCGINFKQSIAMRLRLTSMDKVITLSQNQSQRETGYIITSPFFPMPYVKNSEYYTFEIKALRNNIIIVSFDDWLLSPNSYLKINGARNFDTVLGSDSRPYIISLGSSMSITFYTGEAFPDSSTYLGFRAVAVFLSISFQLVPQISTECDDTVTAEGGYIRLTPSIGRLQDCIWIIKKMPDFDGVRLKILKYDINGVYGFSDDSLDIRRGTISMAELIQSIKPNDRSVNSTALSSRSGFYIRLRGSYSDGASVVLLYTMYKDDCSDYRNYFECENGVCISNKLKCDGYDHCGDKSDEATSLCGYETTHSNSNYPISISVIIPLVVSVFLIIVMCVLIILIRRCRRINAAARNGRIPGSRPPQSRDRHRRRRNRDVQMSVTLSSGEHPPSYDEVLQNTPIGYLNMAFTWSQHGNGPAQPPSYEEAVSPTTAQQNGSITITTTANNVSRGEVNNNLQQPNSSTVLTTTISASLDPRADVSSTSSSEDAADHYSHLNISSSSDSSAENGYSMIAQNCSFDPSKSVTNLDKVGKNSSGVIFQTGVQKYSSGTEGVQVMLESPSSVKLNTEVHEGAKPENSQCREESIRNKNLSVHGGVKQHGENEARDRHRKFEDIRNVSDDRDSRDVQSSEGRSNGRRNEGENYGLSRNEGIGVSKSDRQQGKERVDMYQKHKGKHSGQSGKQGQRLPGQGDYNRFGTDSLNIHHPRVTDSSRSQSCVDLSWGAGRMLDSSRSEKRDEDKRFSYAGAGDVSLARGSLGNFYNGRGLIREKPLEHLDKYASQSSENIRDDYRAKRQGIQHNKAVNGQDSNMPSKHVHSPSNTAYFPRDKRSKSDLLGADVQYSALAPVQENLYDDDYETNMFTVDIPRHHHSENRTTDKRFQDNTSKANNKWSQMPQYRSSSEFGAGSSSAQPNVTQKASSHDTRAHNAVHLHSAPDSSKSFDKPALTSYPQKVYAEDQKKFSHSQDSRRQQEPSYSRQNFKKSSGNQNPQLQEGVKKSQNPADLWRNYEDNGLVPKYEEMTHWDQDRKATVPKPKPSLRMHLQTSQRPDRELSETMPKNSTLSLSTSSEKPTPAPRTGIKKPSYTETNKSGFVPFGEQHQWSYGDPAHQRSHSGTRYPEEAILNSSSGQRTNISGQPTPDSHHMRKSMDGNRQMPRQNSKGDESSEHPSEQTSSRSHLAIQTTNDDVFV